MKNSLLVERQPITRLDFYESRKGELYEASTANDVHPPDEWTSRFSYSDVLQEYNDVIHDGNHSLQKVAVNDRPMISA